MSRLFGDFMNTHFFNKFIFNLEVKKIMFHAAADGFH